jgi:hypothetical protein
VCGFRLWLGVLAGEGRLACRPWADRRCPDRAQLAILEVMRRTTDWQLGVCAVVQGPGEVEGDGPVARHGPGRPVVNVREVAQGAAQVLVASPWFLTAPLYRHWHLRWGATDAEVTAAMPGDELVPNPSFSATRAITIQAPPELVWPWIMQLGTGRAGFYSYDLFDNAARPSADEILPHLQQTQVGDWVPMSRKVTETTAFQSRPSSPTGGCCGPSRTAPGHGPSARGTAAARGW